MDRIDVVVTWVDGSSPSHSQKLARYRDDMFEVVTDDIAGEERFKSVGEIYYCIASILRFAPFVKNIFIVTDQQDPDLTEFVAVNFPESDVNIQIVDHKLLFREHTAYLPTFNSLSIESLMWNIPELSERFVYFNDDLFLINDVEPTDWFREGRAVGYCDWNFVELIRLLRFVKPKRRGHKTFGYKDSMVNGMVLEGIKGKFYTIRHTPQPLLKSELRSYYAANPDMILVNIKHRFRESSQFNPQCLFYNLGVRNGKVVVESSKQMITYIKPTSSRKNYIDKKLDELNQNREYKYLCINSLNKATESDCQKIILWLARRIGVNIDML